MADKLQDLKKDASAVPGSPVQHSSAPPNSPLVAKKDGPAGSSPATKAKKSQSLGDSLAREVSQKLSGLSVASPGSPGGPTATPFNTPTAPASRFSFGAVGTQDQSNIKEQLDALVPASLEFVQSQPIVVQKRIKALQSLHEKHVALESKFNEEMRLLEKKYDELYKPLFTYRSAIVTGRSEPTAEEVNDSELVEAAAKETEAIAGIPEFWLTAFRNFDMFDRIISERDEEAMKFLEDVTYTVNEDGKSFRLDFAFGSNPFFKNRTLTKTYHMLEEEPNEVVLDKAEGTDIEWNEGKDLTVKVVKKKQKKSGSRQVRTVTKTVKCDSFFNFFNPPDPENPEEGDVDEEELGMLLEEDYEMGVAVKERIIPHAVQWYTGDAADDDEDPDYEDDEEYDDEDDEDDEDDDDDDDDDEPVRRGGRGGRKPRKGSGNSGGEGEEKPECKQQ